jgi:hypothetical protein
MVVYDGTAPSSQAFREAVLLALIFGAVFLLSAFQLRGWIGDSQSARRGVDNGDRDRGRVPEARDLRDTGDGNTDVGDSYRDPAQPPQPPRNPDGRPSPASGLQGAAHPPHDLGTRENGDASQGIPTGLSTTLNHPGQGSTTYNFPTDGDRRYRVIEEWPNGLGQPLEESGLRFRPAVNERGNTPQPPTPANNVGGPDPTHRPPPSRPIPPGTPLVSCK